MNELIGASWFFIVAFIMGGIIALGMKILPKLYDFITQLFERCRFINKSDFEHEDYED